MSEDGEGEGTILVNAGMLPKLGLHILLSCSRESASVEKQSTKQLGGDKRVGRSGRIAMDVRNGNPRRKSVREMRGRKKRKTGNTKEMLRIDGLDLFNGEVMTR